MGCIVRVNLIGRKYNMNIYWGGERAGILCVYI